MATEKHGFRADLDLGGDAYSVLEARIVERLDHIPSSPCASRATTPCRSR